MKFYILQKQKEGKTFTHPWTNDNDDFFDGHKYDGVEDFLDKEGYTSGDDPIYKWTEIDSSRIQRTNLDTAIMSIDDETRRESDNYYIKCISENELPLYYYNVDVSEPSNQNNETISYALVLQLDYWSTFGSYYNEFMMSFPADVLFLRKHANRFQFDKEKEKGFWFDYLEQPYLARGEFKGYQLIRDSWEEGLNLEMWKYINTDSAKKNISFDKWWEETYYPWIENAWAGAIYAAKEKENEYPSAGKGIKAPVAVSKELYWQNSKAYAFDYIPDWYYNSNGLYRWLVLKTGKYIIDFNPASGEKIKANNFIDRTNWDLIRSVGDIGDKILDLRDKTEEERQFKQPTYEISYVTTPEGARDYTILSTITYNLSGPYLNDKFRLKWSVPFLIELLTKPVERYNLTAQIGGIFYTLKTSDVFGGNLQDPLVLSRMGGFPWGLREFEVDKWHDGSVWSRGVIAAVDPTKIERFIGSSFQSRVSFGLFDKHTIKFQIKMNFRLFSKFKPDVINITNLDLLHLSTVSDRLIFEKIGAQKDLTLKYPLNADTLILLPVEKSIPAYEYDASGVVPSYQDSSRTIYSLFNSCDVTPGSGSFVGSLINEIPIEILALASRKNFDNENSYTYSSLNLTSTHRSTGDTYKPCPEDLQLLITTVGKKDTGSGKITEVTHYNVLPCLFSDLSYIPVTIARAPLVVNDENKTALGGNNFINSYYDLLSNNDLTSYNTLYSDPIMYSPDIWQWKYLIDGTNEITIIGAYFNFRNMIESQDWEINLNVAMSNATYYKVDLKDLKSTVYPFSKTFSELIGHDSRKFTQYTEDYFNWLQTNQSTYDAAKAGFEINAKRSMIESTIGGLGQGTAAGAQIGSNIGLGSLSKSASAGISAGIGAVVGTGLGAIGAAISKKYNRQLFNLEWSRRFKNMASTPLTVIENGFSTGSLNYTSWENPTFGDRQLFRTYRPSILDRRAIWYDFCWKGYNYYGMGKFSEYDNRKMFNYFQIDTSLDSMLIKHLKNNMCKKSLLFSQTKFIDWFLSKLNSGIRLFKCDFNTDVTKYEDYEYATIVLNNIENEYQEPYISYSGDSIIFRDIEKENPKLLGLIKNKNPM